METKTQNGIVVNVSELKKALVVVDSQMGVEKKDASQIVSHIVFVKCGAGVKILSGLNFNNEVFLSIENDISHIQDMDILYGANFVKIKKYVESLHKSHKNLKISLFIDGDSSFIENKENRIFIKENIFNYEEGLNDRERFYEKYNLVCEISASDFNQVKMPKDSIFLTLYPYSQEICLGNRQSFVSFKTSSLAGVDIEDMLGYKLYGYKTTYLNQVAKAIMKNGLKIYKVKEEHKDYVSYEYCNYVAFAGGVDIRLERGVNFKAVKQGALITKITFTKEDIQALEKMAGKISNNTYIFYENNSLILKEVGINGESFEYDLRDCVVSNRFGVELGLKVEFLKDLLKESDTIEFYDNKQAVNGVGSVAVMLDVSMDREYHNPYYNRKPSEDDREWIEDNIKTLYEAMSDVCKYELYSLYENSKGGGYSNCKDVLKIGLNLTEPKNLPLLELLNTYNQKWVFEYFMGLISSYDVFTSFELRGGVDMEWVEQKLNNSIKNVSIEEIMEYQKLIKDNVFNHSCIKGGLKYYLENEAISYKIVNNRYDTWFSFYDYLQTIAGAKPFEYLKELIMSEVDETEVKEKYSSIEWMCDYSRKYQFAITSDNRYRIIFDLREDLDERLIKYEVSKEIYDFLYSYIEVETYAWGVELRPNVNGLWDKLNVFGYPVAFSHNEISWYGKKFESGAEVYEYIKKHYGYLQRSFIKENAKKLECFAKKLEKRYNINFDIDFSKVNIVRSRAGYLETTIDGYPYLNKNGIYNLAIALKESKMNDFVKIEVKKEYSSYFKEIEKDIIVKCGDKIIENVVGCFCLKIGNFLKEIKEAKESMREHSIKEKLAKLEENYDYVISKGWSFCNVDEDKVFNDTEVKGKMFDYISYVLDKDLGDYMFNFLIRKNGYIVEINLYSGKVNMSKRDFTLEKKCEILKNAIKDDKRFSVDARINYAKWIDVYVDVKYEDIMYMIMNDSFLHKISLFENVKLMQRLSSLSDDDLPVLVRRHIKIYRQKTKFYPKYFTNKALEFIEKRAGKTKGLTLKAKKEMINSFLSSGIFYKKYKGWSKIKGMHRKAMKLDICNDGFIIYIKDEKELLKVFEINSKDFVEWSNNLIKEIETCNDFYIALHENIVADDDAIMEFIDTYPFVKINYKMVHLPRTIIKNYAQHNKTYSASSLIRHFDKLVGALKNKATQLREEQKVIVKELLGWRIISDNGYLFLQHIESSLETFRIINIYDEKNKLESIIYKYCGYVSREYSALTRIHYLYKDILSLWGDSHHLSEELSNIMNKFIHNLSLRELIKEAKLVAMDSKWDAIECISLQVMAITLEYLYDDVLDVTYNSVEAYYTMTDVLLSDEEVMDILLNCKDIENPKGDTESSLTICNNANYGIAYIGASYKQHNVCYAMSI